MRMYTNIRIHPQEIQPEGVQREGRSAKLILDGLGVRKV